MYLLHEMVSLIGVFHWGCLGLTKDFVKVRSNVYLVGMCGLYLTGLSDWVSKKSNMFDISPTPPQHPRLLFQTMALPTWKLTCPTHFQSLPGCSLAVYFQVNI